MSLSLYKPLGDNDEDTRLSAAAQLTSELTVLLAGERTEKAKADVDYALKRLTRGLASGRDSARPGFALVLTEFLTLLQAGENATKWGISLSDLIAAVVRNTASRGHTTGQEERDHWLGRLFGLQSIVQANILFADDTALQEYAGVLDLLFEVAQKKPWLMESSAWTIASSALRWPAATAEKAAEITYRKLVESGTAKTGEGVGIWLALQAHSPAVAAPKDVWTKNNPLLATNLVTLAKVLKESGSNEDGAKQKGSWSPKLGFVWDFVLDAYFSDDKPWETVREGRHGVAAWADFWKTVVDESLFATSSSEERKFWGFLVFLKALDRVGTPQDLAAMFSGNFMRCMINQLSDPERYLSKAAAKVSRALIARAESATWTATVISRQLTTNNGTPAFDQLTKTKTVDKVLCTADESGLVEAMDGLKNIILDPLRSKPDVADPAKAAGVRRQWAADQILSVVRSGKAVKAESWLRNAVEVLVAFGYFDIADKKKNTPAIPISAASQAMFRARLMSCLTHLISLKDTIVQEGEDHNAETWPYIAFKTLTELEEKKKSHRLVVEFDDEISKALQKAATAVEKLRAKRASNPADIQLRSFELLYSLVILQVYNGESDALSVLEDLRSIQTKMLKSGDNKRSKEKKEKQGAEDTDMDPSEVLIDILLSFLSKPSMLLKRLAKTVFTSFCGSVTGRGLQRCFEILGTDEGLDGQASLFDNDGDSEEEEGGDEDSELVSDVEMLGGDAEDSEISDIEILSASSDDADALDHGEEEEEARKLEAALQTVLSAPTGDDSDLDAPEDDEEAMVALDEQIANIFRQRKAAASKKVRKREAKELIVNFKSKILELLEIFVRTSPSSPLVLDVLLPCLVLARSTRHQKLQEKALNTIRGLPHQPKRGALPHHTAAAWEVLEAIHEEVCRGGDTKARRAACSSASIWVVKMLVAADTDNLRRVTEMYGAMMVRWVHDPLLGMDNSFFTNFVGWAGTVRGKLGTVGEKEDKARVRKRKRGGDEEDQEDHEGCEGREAAAAPTTRNDDGGGGGKSKGKKRRRGKGKGKGGK